MITLHEPKHAVVNMVYTLHNVLHILALVWKKIAYHTTLHKWAEHYRIYALKRQFHFSLAYAHVTNVMTQDSALQLLPVQKQVAVPPAGGSISTQDLEHLLPTT